MRFVNAVPRLNADRGPGMPAARKVQSPGGYRLRQLKNSPSTIIAGGPHAIIWTHADEVNRALLDLIGHPGPAGQDGIVRHGPGSSR